MWCLSLAFVDIEPFSIFFGYLACNQTDNRVQSHRRVPTHVGQRAVVEWVSIGRHFSPLFEVARRR
jgi:hypothetical protein